MFKTSIRATFVLGPTAKSRWKWLESEAENRPNLNRLKSFQNSEISPNQHNQQLEHFERIEKRTWIEVNGGWNRSNKRWKFLTKTRLFSAFSGGRCGWVWLEKEDEVTVVLT
ncbi:hypothetical protein L3X38_012210 [Prunus dulcis]|uniref:Uncharacterized protein n=1 Tax=Prunus dulcis TaxID=3755 RepID=A0AAD4ZGF2_PRUDU|nr:hypothetical protein L3X38_012210 [Prunus dulcis]